MSAEKRIAEMDFSALELRVIASSLVPATRREPYPRSPARAKRRAAKGYPQHYRDVPVGYLIDDVYHMHPSVWDRIKTAISATGRMTAPPEMQEFRRKPHRPEYYDDVHDSFMYGMSGYLRNK